MQRTDPTTQLRESAASSASFGLHVALRRKVLARYLVIEWTNDSDAERRHGAEFFGLTEDQLFEVIANVTPAFGQQFGWPNVIWKLELQKVYKIAAAPPLDRRINGFT